MKAFVRFGCGDILEAEAKDVGDGQICVTGPDGPLYVHWSMVFRSREDAEKNKHTPTLGAYRQVFRKPIKVEPMKWYVQKLDGTVIDHMAVKPDDFDEFLSVLEPKKMMK